ncbi:type II CRISPR-associated endonuclease Cas1 [Verrucomicrobiales bacterium]|nr:type II CRISPR-associated endonuclease Cas1 [Verrucomicrobiales bacterium]
MSFHILHLFTHGAVLRRDRGFLVSSPPEDSEAQEARLPLEDIRAVVIASRGITLTSNALAGILSHEGIILHCDESYSPVGVTAPLPRVTDIRATLMQSSRPKRLNASIWNRLLLGKTANQMAVLASFDLSSAHLERALTTRKVDEGNCARRYWQLYFPEIGWSGSKRERRLENPPNRMLNYGYAVLATLCHRSLLIHGLTPLLGVGHVARYRSDPLVYDLMEPYRPVVDRILADFLCGEDVTEQAWCRRIGTELRNFRVRHSRYSLKLMDAIDKSASSLARCYSQSSADALWIPELGA